MIDVNQHLQKMIIHVQNVHQKSDNGICTECNKSIKQRNLNQHLKMFHSGEQPNFSLVKNFHKKSSQ